MKKIILNIVIMVMAISFVGFTSCTTEDLEPTLAQSKKNEEAFSTVGSIESHVYGVHDFLTATEYYGRDLIATNEVRSDNCFSNSNSGRFLTEARFKYNSNAGFIWRRAYQLIANANMVINMDLSSLEGDKNKGKYVQGQAKILRALAHYDLLRVYGQQHTTGGDLGVPIVTVFKGDNPIPKRDKIEDVKKFIYKELDEAYEMMNAKYDGKPIFVSKQLAQAVKARVAIYFGDYQIAKDASEKVIKSGKYKIAPAGDFVSNWAKENTSNSIFELSFSAEDNRGSNSLPNIYRFASNESTRGYGDVQVMSSVIDIFEDNDVRKGILGYQMGGTVLRNMGKYPDTGGGASNIFLFRYEEVILNYAEALFELGSQAEALKYLNKVPKERNATIYTSVTKENILNERRKEFMFEGLRFDDLMRTKKALNIVSQRGTVEKELSYPNDKFAYPIPDSEMNANSNMIQNKSY